MIFAAKIGDVVDASSYEGKPVKVYFNKFRNLREIKAMLSELIFEKYKKQVNQTSYLLDLKIWAYSGSEEEYYSYISSLKPKLSNGEAIKPKGERIDC